MKLYLGMYLELDVAFQRCIDGAALILDGLGQIRRGDGELFAAEVDFPARRVVDPRGRRFVARHLHVFGGHKDRVTRVQGLVDYEALQDLAGFGLRSGDHDALRGLGDGGHAEIGSIGVVRVHRDKVAHGHLGTSRQRGGLTVLGHCAGHGFDALGVGDGDAAVLGGVGALGGPCRVGGLVGLGGLGRLGGLGGLGRVGRAVRLLGGVHAVPAYALGAPPHGHQVVVLGLAGGVVVAAGVVSRRRRLHVGVELAVERHSLGVIRVPADALVLPAHGDQPVLLGGGHGVVMVRARVEPVHRRVGLGGRGPTDALVVPAGAHHVVPLGRVCRVEVLAAVGVVQAVHGARPRRQRRCRRGQNNKRSEDHRDKRQRSPNPTTPVSCHRCLPTSDGHALGDSVPCPRFGEVTGTHRFDARHVVQAERQRPTPRPTPA